MPQNGWHRDDVVGREQQVGMTQTGRLHIDENFAPDRRCDLHVLEIEPTAHCVYDKRLHTWNLPVGVRCVQDIFTIESISIKYRNGTAASAIFPCRRRRAALRASGTQAARRAACPLPPD